MRRHWGGTQHDLRAAEEGAQASPWLLAVVESQGTEASGFPWLPREKCSLREPQDVSVWHTKSLHPGLVNSSQDGMTPKGHWGNTQGDLGAVEEGAPASPQLLAIAKSQSTKMLTGPRVSPRRGVVGKNCKSLQS